MKYFLIAVSIMLTTPISATAQSFWDGCDKAIEAGDTAEIAKLAKLMLTFKTIADANLKKAERCVSAANDVELFYIEGYGFADQIMRTEIVNQQKMLDQIWTEREAVVAERNSLTSKYSCLTQQHDLILDHILDLKSRINTQNLVQLATATFEASKRKFEKEPDETLLSELCQKAFNDNYFPGAKNRDLIAEWEQTQEKFLVNIQAKAQIDVALINLSKQADELEVKWKAIRGDNIDQTSEKNNQEEKKITSIPNEEKIIDCD